MPSAARKIERRPGQKITAKRKAKKFQRVKTANKAKPGKIETFTDTSLSGERKKFARTGTGKQVEVMLLSIKTQIKLKEIFIKELHAEAKKKKEKGKDVSEDENDLVQFRDEIRELEEIFMEFKDQLLIIKTAVRTEQASEGELDQKGLNFLVKNDALEKIIPKMTSIGFRHREFSTPRGRGIMFVHGKLKIPFFKADPE